MASRSPARWLAPLALLGSVAAIMIVVAASNGGGSGDGDAASTGITGSTATSATTTTATTATTTVPAASGPRFYVVEEGDVLSAIAATTGVPLAEIERLNPDVDAQTLHAGQRIKLRP